MCGVCVCVCGVCVCVCVCVVCVCVCMCVCVGVLHSNPSEVMQVMVDILHHSIICYIIIHHFLS